MKTRLIGLACALAVGGAVAGVTGVVDAQIDHQSATPISMFEDIVSGDWEGTISNEQMPEDIEVLIALELDGEAVTGGFTVEGDTADFSGDFDADDGTIIGVLSDPDSGQDLDTELTIDGDDMTGVITIEAGDMIVVLDINATRVE